MGGADIFLLHRPGVDACFGSQITSSVQEPESKEVQIQELSLQGVCDGTTHGYNERSPWERALVQLLGPTLFLLVHPPDLNLCRIW